MDRSRSPTFASPFILPFPSAGSYGSQPPDLYPSSNQPTFPSWNGVMSSSPGREYDSPKPPASIPSPLTNSTTSSRIRVPQTYAQWIREAKDNTRDILTNGCSSPLAWIFVQGTDIPANAVFAGDDCGKPLYIARTFYECTIQVGKAAQHFKQGAKISYSGVEVDVSEYEVLVEALTPVRWAFLSQPRPPVTFGIENLSLKERYTATTGAILERDMKEIKLVVLIDDSLSMTGSSWNAVREVLGQVAGMAKDYNTDGFDLFFLNNDHSRHDIRDKFIIDTVFNLVIPSGQTPTGSRLQDIFNLYVPRLDPLRGKPVVVVVVTDGAPTDDLEGTVVNGAKRLEEMRIPLRMLGVQFVQIGDDPKAAAALKRLDDGLASTYGIRDMVTATVYDPFEREFRVDKFVRVLRTSIEYALSTSGPASLTTPTFVGGPGMPFPTPIRKNTV